MTDHEDEGDARARPTCESNNNTAAISNGTVDTSRLKSEKDDNRTNPKKRGMKPRSQRNRKRPRGGIGCLVGDKDDGNNENTDQNSETTIHDQSPSTILRIDVVPLSKAFEMISGMKISKKGHPEEPTINTKNIDHHEKVHDQRRVRIIHPYPYTFATFAKSRWINRTVVDIYHEEFGSYPKTYYEAAIKAGRILVSGKRVNCDYKVKGGDELTHAVHRHEPAVGLADNVKFGILSDGEKEAAPPPIHIVHEDESLLIVDKPATLPIHPCGGYNYNSLFEILSHWKPQLYGSGKLFTIHRLDRLTSGLVLVAKSSALARSLGKCIMERDGCEKIYLTRVKGKFPLNLQQVGHGKKVEKVEIGTEVRNDKHHPWRFQKCDHGEIESGCSSSIPPPCMNGEFTSECNEKVWKGGLKFSIPSFDGNKKRGKNNKASSDLDQRSKDSIAALGYWITNEDDSIIENASLQQLFDQSSKMSMEEILATATSSRPENDTGDETISDIAFTRMPIRWLNFACPCRVSSHKNGICEAGDFSHLINDFGDKSNANNGQENSSQPGKGIKPAQTSFTLLSYDASTNTSLVLAKPITGRTHQIRLHAQALGHPIANDHCYGGELWCGDEQGKEACRKSRDWLDRLDRGDIDIGSSDYGTATAREESNGTSGARIAPENSTISDVPATEAEIYHAAANRSRADGESILEFIEKTCVWCARCRGVAEIGHWDKCHGEVDEEKLRQEQQSAVFRRTLMEYLVRSQGIWLHALQYSLKTMDEQGREKTLRYRTRLPFWAVPLQAANLCCDK